MANSLFFSRSCRWKGHVKRRVVKPPAERIHRFVERKKGGQGLKKIVDACPRRGEPRDRTGAVDWNGVPRVIHGGWMRPWKGGGRESNAKRVRRDEKCTDSTFKSIAVVACFLSMARALGPMGFNPQRESSGERKKVSSGRLPLLIGRESTIHTDSPLFCLACYRSTLVSNVFRKRCSPSSGIFELCSLRVFASEPVSTTDSSSFCLISV